MNLLYLNQFKTTTLSVPGGIDASQTDSIVAQSVAGIDTTKPGIACVSYSDPINVDNAEWFEYQSINSTTKEFQGVTRGAEGYSAKSHDNGAVIAFPVSESHINRLADALSIEGDPTNGVTGVLDDDTMATASATTLATSESVKAYVDNGTWNKGWIPVGAITRVSDTTATLVGDWTDRIQKGDKIWWLSDGSPRYNYVVASPSFGAGVTTITITAGYVTTANDSRFESGHSLTAPYISHIENPFGFPDYFNYTPTLTNLSGGSIVLANFKIYNNVVSVMFHYLLGGAGVAGAISLTTPIASSANYSTEMIVGKASFIDTGTVAYDGLITLSSTTTALLRVLKVDATYSTKTNTSSTVPFTWTNNDRVQAIFDYQI